MAVKHIDIREFREIGFLQEINRQFLHPLGMALEVVVDDDGTERLGGIWDYRDDTEGILFGDSVLDAKKAENVQRLMAEKHPTRKKLLGFVVQPVPPAGICPRCGKGRDTDGDGDCPFCCHMSDEDLKRLHLP